MDMQKNGTTDGTADETMDQTMDGTIDGTTEGTTDRGNNVNSSCDFRKVIMLNFQKINPLETLYQCLQF